MVKVERYVDSSSERKAVRSAHSWKFRRAGNSVVKTRRQSADVNKRVFTLLQSKMATMYFRENGIFPNLSNNLALNNNIGIHSSYYTILNIKVCLMFSYYEYLASLKLFSSIKGGFCFLYEMLLE